MKTKIGIQENKSAEVARILNQFLADEHVLYLKTRQAHWNIEGPDFHAMHLFFEDQYTALQIYIDDLAERIRTLGHYAVATMKDYVKMSHLSESAPKKNDSMTYIKALLSDHEALIIHFRESIEELDEKCKDAGSSDFVTSLMEKHEKMAWMLRAHLK